MNPVSMGEVETVQGGSISGRSRMLFELRYDVRVFYFPD